MARTRSNKSSSSKTALAAENQALRQQLEQGSVHEAMLLNRLTMTGGMGRPTGELWVGIRNVSDNTVGVKSPFSHEPDLDLHGSATPNRPGSVAVISYAWWLQLRASKYVAQGYLVRDDSILAGHFTAGPADLDEQLPAEARYNAILDPFAWIEGQSDTTVEAAMRKVTSRDSLRRLRRAVDDRLREQERAMAGDPNAPRKAYEQLPPIYRRVDELATVLLERPDTMV